MNGISGVVGAVLPGAQPEAVGQTDPAQTETFGVAMLLALLSNQSPTPNVTPTHATVDGASGPLIQGDECSGDGTVPAKSANAGLDCKPAAGEPVVSNATSGMSHHSLLGQALAGPFLAYTNRAITPNKAPQAREPQAPVPTQPTVAKANTVLPLTSQLEVVPPVAGQKQVVTPQSPAVATGITSPAQKVVLQSGSVLQPQSLPLAAVQSVPVSESGAVKKDVLNTIQQVPTDTNFPKASLVGVTVESLEVTARTNAGVARPAVSPNVMAGPRPHAVEPVSPTDVQRVSAPEVVKGVEQPKTGTAAAVEQTQVPPAVGAARMAVKTSRPTAAPETRSPPIGDRVQEADLATIAAGSRRGLVRPALSASYRSVKHPAAPKPGPHRQPQVIAGQVKQGARGADTDGQSNAPANTRVLSLDGFQNPAMVRVTSGRERATVTTATNGADKLGQMESTTRTEETALRSNPADRVTLKFTDDQGVEGRVRVAVRGHAVRATILSDDPVVARRLGADLGELQQALDQQGFRDAQLTVQQVRRTADLGGVAMASSARAAVDASSNTSGSRGPDEQGNRDRPQQEPRDSHNSGNGRSQQRSRQRQER